MSTPPPPQRAYRAACPNCGAAVEFRSAASAFAVCSFCHSTLAREGAELRRIGEAAELFADHSPLQLGVTGRFLNAPFTLVGRLQYLYDGGVWNEWHAAFDGGRHGWLSEDNGRYVLTFETRIANPPAPQGLRVGAELSIGGQAWTVSAVVRARLGAIEGELLAPPSPGEQLVVELRNPRGDVAALEYGAAAAVPAGFVGRTVELPQLELKGLKEESARTLQVRAVPCPQCGAALAPTLASTRSIVCGQCHAVVDVSKGLGADLSYYAQLNAGESGLEAQIPLGATAQLALGAPAASWQVVGYVERCTVPMRDGDDVEFWREYLLYQRTRGFAFLVDAQDGWSWTAPVAGAPRPNASGIVPWQGVDYRELYRYVGKVSYVLGEFYWNLSQEERTSNIDYAEVGGGPRRLSCEKTGEIVWSAGAALDAAAVAHAFGLPDAAPLQRDATPLALNAGHLKLLFAIALLVILVAEFASCSSGRRDCSDVAGRYGVQSDQYQACLRGVASGAPYRSSGGTFGGFGSGGGHK